MIRILGISLWLAAATCAWSSPTHVGPDGTEIPEGLPDPADLSMPEVQVLRFLGQHFPEMLNELEAAEAKGPEAKRELLDRARGIIFEWEEHFRMGEHVANNFIEVERLHYTNDQLVPKYLKLQAGPDKQRLGEEIRANIAKIHELRLGMESAELKRLKDEIAAIERNLVDSRANRDSMIESELRDLLEFWRLDQLGKTADRPREEPLIPDAVISPEVIEEPGVEPATPVVKAVPLESEVADRIIVNITNEGSLILEEEPVSLEQAEEILAAKAKENPDQPVLIRADKSTLFEKVISVMEVCRKVGLSDILFAVKAEAE